MFMSGKMLGEDQGMSGFSRADLALAAKEVPMSEPKVDTKFYDEPLHAHWPLKEPEAPKEPKALKEASPRPRYEGSLAQRLDAALMEGGQLASMAEQLGVTKGRLRAHAKFRDLSGKYKLTEDGDVLRLKKVA